MWTSATSEGRFRILAVATGAVLALLLGAAIAVHVVWDVPLGRPITGGQLSTGALVLQAVALVIGTIVINIVSHARARGVTIALGIVCLAAYGTIAIAWVWMLLAWWLLIGRAGFGILRIVAAFGIAAVFAVVDREHALVFALLFGMRLVIFTYDRWQNRAHAVLTGDFLVYVLPAPLIVVVPYLAIIPIFDTYAARLQFGITREKLQLAASQLVLAAIAGGGYALAAQWQPPGIAAMYWSLLLAILELTVVAYVALPLLVLHGVLERSPVDRPLLATRLSELWRRYGVHLRDALMFLFYVPALLRLRSHGRYVRIALAVGWTVIVGNTLLHVVLRYAYLDDGLDRTLHALAGNTVLAIALALDLCHQEWRGDVQPSAWRQIAGWLVAFTIAAIAGSL